MESNTNNSLKAFWKRPEGKPGMVVLAGLLIGGGYLLYKALPTIITLMENMYYAIGLGLGLTVIFSLLMSSKFRTTVWYLYKGLIRAFTGMVIELNPIAILESYVEDLKEKMVTIGKQITDLNGQRGKIKKKIEDMTEEYNEAVGFMRAANAKGDKGNTAVYARQSERLKKYLTKLENLYTRMSVLYEMLKKMEYYSDIMVKDTEMTVKITKDEREAITKSHSVMKSAMNIIQGNTDKKMIFDQSMESVLDDIGYKVGEMDRMLEQSTDFITKVDLEDDMFAEKGLKMLEQFDNDSIDRLFGTKPAAALPGTQPNYLDANQIQKSQPTPVNYNNTNNNNGSDKKKYF